MGTLHPYLQRRVNQFYFRISVPATLRQLVGVREFTTTLKTSDRKVALPLALELGATAHRLFNDLHMTTNNQDLLKLLSKAQEKLRVDAVRAEMEEQVVDAHRARIAGIQEAQRAAAEQIKLARLEAQNMALKDALDRALSAREAVPHPAPPPPVSDSPAPCETELHVLIDEFLTSYGKDKKPAMFKKHQAAMELFRELHGTKPFTRLLQKDLVHYFDVVEGLPPRWAEKCKKRGIGAQELSLENHEETLSKKTFDDNYVNPVGLFLKWARRNWQDQGFSSTLTIEGTEYQGDAEEGANKQRAITQGELEQLFHHLLLPYSQNPSEDHKWWLPVLAFYTGARVNELCQLNPQVDIGVTSDQIHFLHISQDTEGDLRIKKSVKTGYERFVPLHPDLVASGFIEYVNRVREAGSRLLFPAWAPTNGRASTQAERWFRDLLADSGLRDETPFNRLVGFHAFRHTLLTRAADSHPTVDAGPLTGHTDSSKGGAQRGYEGQRSLPHKFKLLKAIQFEFKP
jgi:Phage integrase family